MTICVMVCCNCITPSPHGAKRSTHVLYKYRYMCTSTINCLCNNANSKSLVDFQKFGEYVILSQKSFFFHSLHFLDYLTEAFQQYVGTNSMCMLLHVVHVF